MSVVLTTPFIAKSISGTLSVSSTKFTTSDTVTLTFTMTSASATGTVSFYSDGVSITTATVSGNVATANIGLSVGVHNITAAYSGDSVYQPVYSSNSIQVSVSYNTSISLSYSFPSNGNPSGNPISGQTVTLTATVSGGTGTVIFYNGSTVLGTSTISGSTATYSYTSIPNGSYSFSAVYSGSTVYYSTNNTDSFILDREEAAATLPTSLYNPATSTTAIVTVDSAVSSSTVNYSNFPATSTAWTVPTGVTSISVIAIGAGASTSDNLAASGGGGGGLAYVNNYPVTPGDTYYIINSSGIGFSPAPFSPSGGNQYVLYAGNGTGPNYPATGQGGTAFGTVPGVVAHNGGNGGVDSFYQVPGGPVNPSPPYNPGLLLSYGKGGGGGGAATATANGGYGGGSYPTFSSAGGPPNGGNGANYPPGSYSQTTTGYGAPGGGPGVPSAPYAGFGAGGVGQYTYNAPGAPGFKLVTGGPAYFGILYGNTPTTKTWPTGN